MVTDGQKFIFALLITYSITFYYCSQPSIKSIYSFLEMTSPKSVFSFEPVESAINEYDGILPSTQQHRTDDLRVVVVAAKRHAPNTDECWNFDFPGVTEEVSAIYHDSLVAMERWCPIADTFTQPEVNLIVAHIDNNDYVSKMYPGQNVGWHGLLNDNGIFRAIARFKVQTGYPKLSDMLRVCSTIDPPMPKHLYYVYFKAVNGETLRMSYRSGDEVLKL